MNAYGAIKDFHATSNQREMSAIGTASWVTRLIPYRRIDYRVFSHYHPYSEELIEKLNRDGLRALLDPVYHKSLEQTLSPQIYLPGPNTDDDTFPIHDIDVSSGGAYSLYNWEMFFHAPLAVAVHLSTNQRFEDAQRWFHRIFDPTSTDMSIPPPQRFWKFLRFREQTTPEFIGEILQELSNPEDSEIKDEILTTIQEWRDKPFRPHVIARGRYLAYQLNVLMKYLDNLLAWGDSLFRQDTIETLNEATQIYVLAANLLGPKPQKVPSRHKYTAKTYAQLSAIGIDEFGNALIELENSFPMNTSLSIGGDASSSGAEAVFGIGRTLYFCIPPNEKLLEYWDKVADRLFKIRHCMNIEGVVRQLPLFDPPIDPGALVRAAAAGLDIASIVNNINQPVSTIRGPLLLNKAIELCREVRALGSSLLTALEKGDAEHIALVRQQYELSNLHLSSDVKFLHWKEAEAGTDALLKSREVVWERFKHYKRILGATDGTINSLKTIDLMRNGGLTEENFDTAYGELVDKYAKDLARESYRKETTVGGLMEFAGNTVVDIFGGTLGDTLPLNKNEHAELNIYFPSADVFSAASIALKIAAPLLAFIPQFKIHATPLGVGGATEFGGDQLSKGAKLGSEYSDKISDAFESSAKRAARLASYYRRAEDYVYKANEATCKLEQYGREIVSSLLREQILKREYDNHAKMIEDVEAQEEFVREKFTNEELYGWMQGELSKVYYDSYKFCYDVAKRAEQTLKHELMRPEFDNLNLIKFGYWDSGRKGLLAGENLYLDLRRLEMAYMEQNRREYEMSRSVSLARLDPIALLKLKATGSCEVTLPEWLFDMDSPGQYMRRLKTVSLTIPCDKGPYTGLHCKLSLLRSSIRVSSLLGDQYDRSETEDDNRFRDYMGSIQSVVTSTAQDDAGLFEVNLQDKRYLPFEGGGAISTWRIELPNDFPQFDHASISDVVFNLRYTAREAGHLENAASESVLSILETPDTLLQLFSLNSDFSAAWANFVGAASDATRVLSISVDQERFPYWVERLGMDDSLMAVFAVVDWKKRKLSVAPASVAFTGNADSGWTIDIDQTSPVFAFLKKYSAVQVHMMVSYLAA